MNTLSRSILHKTPFIEAKHISTHTYSSVFGENNACMPASCRTRAREKLNACRPICLDYLFECFACTTARRGIILNFLPRYRYCVCVMISVYPLEFVSILTKWHTQINIKNPCKQVIKIDRGIWTFDLFLGEVVVTNGCTEICILQISSFFTKTRYKKARNCIL